MVVKVLANKERKTHAALAGHVSAKEIICAWSVQTETHIWMGILACHIMVLAELDVMSFGTDMTMKSSYLRSTMNWTGGCKLNKGCSLVYMLAFLSMLHV